jgi:hypothetical protein
MDNLERMVTIPRKLGMDQLQYNLVLGSQMTWETNVINASDGGRRK